MRLSCVAPGEAVQQETFGQAWQKHSTLSEEHQREASAEAGPARSEYAPAQDASMQAHRCWTLCSVSRTSATYGACFPRQCQPCLLYLKESAAWHDLVPFQQELQQRCCSAKAQHPSSPLPMQDACQLRTSSGSMHVAGFQVGGAN